LQDIDRQVEERKFVWTVSIPVAIRAYSGFPGQGRTKMAIGLSGTDRSYWLLIAGSGNQPAGI